MITSTLTRKTASHQVELHITDAPPVTLEDEHGSEQYAINGLRLTYDGDRISAIRYFTTAGSLFVSKEDLAAPDTWPGWLRTLVEAYRPIPEKPSLEALHAVTKEDYETAATLVSEMAPRDRAALTNQLDILRHIADRES